MNLKRLLPIAAILLATLSHGETPTPLPQAHAHNDYEHDRPLLDALSHGFCSVEADIHLVDGALLVAHDADQVKPDRTLQSLYLDPLHARFKKNKGSIHPDGPTFTLLVDIKTDGRTTYTALAEVLKEYKDMLTVVKNDKLKEGAVHVIISGNRPREIMMEEKTRYAGYDGRLINLGADWPAHFMPLVSDRWGSHFKWSGFGPMPEKERQKLHDAVKRAHDKGRRIQFWATFDKPLPARKAVWEELQKANVDLINTDDLPALQKFLSN